MPATEDPQQAALAAGLRYVEPDLPGLTRRRCGKGFTYRTATGRTLTSARDRRRIDQLAIPPAWEEVWICPFPDGHVQATGRDARGRKQYRYHPEWEAVRAADKFEHLAVFGVELAAIRRQVAVDLGRRGMPRERVVALVVRLLDETLIRVGNPQYARDESFGLTTLQARHLDDDGRSLVFEFRGKSGIEHEAEVVEPALVRAVRACHDLGGHQLFTYRDGDEIRDVCSDDVNDYLRDICRSEVSARDFRTWGGTVSVVEALGPVDPGGLSAGDRTRQFLSAVDLAAERLGNTRSVCRSSYVHPAVEPAFESGDLRASWQRARRTKRLTRAERATLRLLVDDAASR